MAQKPSKIAKNLFFGFFEGGAFAPIAPPGSATDFPPESGFGPQCNPLHLLVLLAAKHYHTGVINVFKCLLVADQ